MFEFRSAFQEGVKVLRERGVENASLETKILLDASIKNVTTNNRPKSNLTEAEFKLFNNALKRRGEKHEPIAYILEEKEFYSRQFKCKAKETLIPRPETEMFVDVSKFIFKNYYLSHKPLPKTFRILEGGVGTGAIIISIIKELETTLESNDNNNTAGNSNDKCKIMGVGTDISSSALEVAKSNVEVHQCQEKITLLQTDWFKGLDLSSFQIICANPPYIPSHHISQLHPSVKLWEPITALDGGDDGLKYYKHIYDQLCSSPIRKTNDQKDTTFVVLEVGFDQAGDVKSIFCDDTSSNFCCIRVIKDLAQIERTIIFSNNFELQNSPLSLLHDNFIFI